MNKFVLKRFVIGREPSVELTKAEYDAIREAQRRTGEALALEDSFNLVLGNYEEFEQELLSLALKRVISETASFEWDAAIDTLSLASRRLMNLLTTTKAYEDHVGAIISRWYGGTSAEFLKQKKLFNREYDSALGYRVCCALRNHAQHAGAPVHYVSNEATDITGPDGKRAQVTFMFAPSISVDALRENDRFKARVLAELEQGGHVSVDGVRTHDVRPFVRAFVSGLGRVHVDLRALIAEEVAKNDATIADAVSRYHSLPDAESEIGLAVMELNQQELREGRPPHWVSERPIQRRREFERRNDHPVRFDQTLVSNGVKQRDR